MQALVLADKLGGTSRYAALIQTMARIVAGLAYCVAGQGVCSMR